LTNHDFIHTKTLVPPNKIDETHEESRLDDEQSIISKNGQSRIQSSRVPEYKCCRICLGEENEQDNEMITPCKCKGTMQFIHVNCLQEWVNGKKSVRELPFSCIYLFRLS
jgi:hypothetical protein